MLFKNSSDSSYTPESTGRTPKAPTARVDAVPQTTRGELKEVNVTIELMALDRLDLSVGGWQHGTTPRNHSRTFQRADKKRAVEEEVKETSASTSSEIPRRVFVSVCLRFHLHSKIIEQKESMLLCSVTAPSNLLPSAMSHITQSAHKQRMAEPHVVATQKKKVVPSSLPSAAFTDQLRWKYSSWKLLPLTLTNLKLFRTFSNFVFLLGSLRRRMSSFWVTMAMPFCTLLETQPTNSGDTRRPQTRMAMPSSQFI